MTEVTDEELERRMRAKLLTGRPTPAREGLTDQQRRIAERLIGVDNVQRLERQDGTRRFRPTPVRVHYEYWWVAGTNLYPGGWNIARVENGRQQQHLWDHGDIGAEVKRLRAKGHIVREIAIGFQPTGIRKPEGNTTTRKRIVDQLKDFRG